MKKFHEESEFGNVHWITDKWDVIDHMDKLIEQRKSSYKQAKSSYKQAIIKEFEYLLDELYLIYQHLEGGENE